MCILTLSIYSPSILLRCSFFYLPTVEFSIDEIQDIEWNEEAFSNLVLLHDHKYLLQSLVQAHHNEIGFDDFIKGEGHGLVVTTVTFLVPLVLVSDLHIKRQIFLVELISSFSSSSRENFLSGSYE